VKQAALQRVARLLAGASAVWLAIAWLVDRGDGRYARPLYLAGYLLLPGAMLRNRDLKFHCEHVYVRVEQTDTPFTQSAARGQRLRIPIAHGEGNYYAEPEVVRELEASRRVIFRYCDARGEVTEAGNPNGSVNNIAGICSEARNIVGLMPHPERACEMSLGSADGLVMFESVLAALTREGAYPGARPERAPASRGA